MQLLEEAPGDFSIRHVDVYNAEAGAEAWMSERGLLNNWSHVAWKSTLVERRVGTRSGRGGGALCLGWVVFGDFTARVVGVKVGPLRDARLVLLKVSLDS